MLGPRFGGRAAGGGWVLLCLRGRLGGWLFLLLLHRSAFFFFFFSFGVLLLGGFQRFRRLRGDILSPDSSLTKIWKLSEDGDEDVEVEEALDDERDVRMLGDPVRE